MPQLAATSDTPCSQHLTAEQRTWIELVHQLQQCGYCFAIYRLPHHQQIHMVLSTQAQCFTSWDELAPHSGFVLVPFDPKSGHPFVLIEPEHHFQGLSACNSGLQALLQQQPTNLPPAPMEAQPALPDWISYDAQQQRAAYQESFAQIQTALHHDCHKLVLSRAAAFNSAEPIDTAACFLQACTLYPNMMVTLSSTPFSGTWLGSTPEVLLSGFSTKETEPEPSAGPSSAGVSDAAAAGDQPAHAHHTEWHTMALAGTMPLNNGAIPPLSDWSDKNRHEQAIVTQFLANTLIPWVSELQLKGPYSAQAGNLVHLKTDVKFKLENDANLPQVLNQLHPTPAVCGMPKHTAYEVIRQAENYDRSYYAGAIGLYQLSQSYAQDSSEASLLETSLSETCLLETKHCSSTTTQLFVNLRCMQFLNRKLAVCYAGGGILRESDEASEFVETQKKMETMRRLLEQA